MPWQLRERIDRPYKASRAWRMALRTADFHSLSQHPADRLEEVRRGVWQDDSCRRICGPAEDAVSAMHRANMAICSAARRHGRK